MDDYRERARKRLKERPATRWYKLLVGENTFRVLPTPESKTTPSVWMEFMVHREVGPKQVRVRCGKDPYTGEGECMLCDKKIPQLISKGRDSLAAKLEPEIAFVVQVSSVNDDGKFKGAQVFNPSAKKKLIDPLITLLGSKRHSYSDPKKGRNLNITRVGTGKYDTDYIGPVPDEDASEVPPEIIAKLKPFSMLDEIPKYDEDMQRAALLGQDVQEKARPSKSESKRVEPEPDEDEDEVDGDEDELEDDDEEIEDEDEDDVPVTPKKKAAAKGKNKPVIHDPEDDADEDADEDEELEDDDEELEDEELGDDEDEPEPPPAAAKRKGPQVVKTPAKATARRSVIDDEDDDEAAATAATKPAKKAAEKAFKPRVRRR